jgi:hypothetical protein
MSCNIIRLYELKIVYHCFSCKVDFTNMETAKNHSKSLYHDVTERVMGASREGKSLLV